ncbi:NADH-quinone oxidoreductase subunit M [Paremcibacter congregatus]|uniref:NADH-quinone oxidoreductase subunit M n=1 Tax=Paremcibacter congregatus TaxID=2043170 RepID=A0A2G4YSL4_9PROT|nr:NADH-quinone oxidoreductase subunit M [Paremcibacter congregatus]PHZ85324.1 NADH-quinone oxidoreductase subunit M [Paremcibacter congregatus]QDE27744.1 NADH-quinone oxidoreductase subunit M [Paremcibacter congregatus]
MENFPILSIITFLPLLGVVFILLTKGENAERNAKNAALWVTIFTFIASLILWFTFDKTTADFQFVEKTAWLGDNINYHMGVDGISILFVMLTTFIMPIVILTGWDVIKDRVKEYLIAFLILETLMIGVFCALDIVLFYMFFEGGLIPMFLIIGIWGGKNRVYASYKLFLYTLLGSVFMLLAMLYMYFQAGTTDIPTLMAHGFDVNAQTWLFLAFFASFAVKMPMWPVHTWLPDAHVQAPTAGSVILAGILLKMGGYGFLRFSLPMFPHASVELAWLIYTLSVIAIIYTSLVALMQQDMKKLIAYSSVAHMGFVTLGIFTFNSQGIEGAIMVMLAHGFVASALFLCVGVIYDRLHTREISRYGGLVNIMPKYALTFMFFTMASVGLPGTGNFVGEILVLIGLFKVSVWTAFFAATGLILGAAYMLWLYRKVVFGELVKEDLKAMMDMDRREILIFAPLVIFTLWMGIYPATFMEFMHVSVENLITNHQAALSAVAQTVAH